MNGNRVLVVLGIIALSLLIAYLLGWRLRAYEHSAAVPAPVVVLN